jgi:hypothetical protein
VTALWIVLAMLLAALGGWPVTAGVLRAARTADALEAAEQDRSNAAPAADRDAAVDPAATTAAPTATATEGAAPTATATEGAAPTANATEGAAAESPVGRTLSPGEQLTSTEVLRGGLVIGILERTAVVLAILTAQPIAIAYVVAIKALGRYPELKQTPAASERFIIGTLASMLWAAGIGTLAKWLLVG